MRLIDKNGSLLDFAEQFDSTDIAFKHTSTINQTFTLKSTNTTKSCLNDYFASMNIHSVRVEGKSSVKVGISSDLSVDLCLYIDDNPSNILKRSNFDTKCVAITANETFFSRINAKSENYTIYFGVLKNCSAKNFKDEISYNLSIDSVFCRYYDENENNWSSQGCNVI